MKKSSFAYALLGNLLIFGVILLVLLFGGWTLQRLAPPPNRSSTVEAEFEENETPDAITRETVSPDGKWVGVIVYRSQANGKPGGDLFALRPTTENLARNADGEILSTVYAGKTGTEIQKVTWRNARTVVLSLRSPRSLWKSLPTDSVLARFRGITVRGERSIP